MSDDVATVTERASTVRADNPGLMTLDGTNTWILREPGAARSVVVDPGPADATHLDRVLGAAGESAWCCSRTATSTTPSRCRWSPTAPARRHGPPTRSSAVDAVPARRRRDHRRRRPAPGRAGHARPHGRLHLLPAARRAVAAHRRHRARPRHDGHRPPRRRARPVPRLPRASCASWSRRAWSSASCPVMARSSTRRPRCSTSTSSTARNASTRCAPPWTPAPRRPLEVVERVYTDVDQSLWPAAELSVTGPARLPADG